MTIDYPARLMRERRAYALRMLRSDVHANVGQTLDVDA